MIIKSNFGIDEMLNNETLPCKICINLHKSMVEVLDSEDDIREENVLIPTIDELYPYNKCMYDFLGNRSVPKGMSASHYLRIKQMMREFYVYRQSVVVNRLIGWLQARDFEIKYEDYVEDDSCHRQEQKGIIVTAQLLMETVAEYYKISVEEILSRDRDADVVRARYITMYLCANMLHMSAESIGSFVGNRNDSMVIYACKQIADEVERSTQLATEIEFIKKKVHFN